MSGQFFIDTALKSADRYDMAKFMEFTDNYDPLTSAMLDAIPNLSQNGSFTVQGEDGRPDLLAKHVYDSESYWWILLFYNHIIEYANFSTGQTLAFPSTDSLEDVYFSLKAQQTGKS